MLAVLSLFAEPRAAVVRWERMPDVRPLKVLLVEDESLVALDIETMLEEMGCKVVASVPAPERA